MLQNLLVASCAVFVVGHLYGQAPAEFEVVTIKPAPPQSDGRTDTRMSSNTDTGKLTYSNVNLKQVIGKAYKVQQNQIDGPDWFETDRFDIVARFPPHSSAEQVLLMLQAVLAERFKLALHRDTKELPIYELIVAKNGPKLKTAEAATGITSNSNRAQWHVVAKVSMEEFAEFLTGEVGRPVLDKTGLTGSYEMTLDWAADTVPLGNDGAVLPSLFTAVQELGLQLRPSKGRVETLVVDSVARKPTEN